MMRSQTRERIAVQLPEHASPKQCHELGAFARYCILRVERELGEWESWVVHVVPSPDGYASHIALHDRGELLEEQGSGQDGALATWDAMCRIEQRMRERRRRDPAVSAGAPSSGRTTMVPATSPTPATLPRHRHARHRPARHRPARAASATSQTRRPRNRRAPAR
jgi:hypothetical protein